MISEISFSTWNINGIHNKVLGDKSKNRDFVDAISNTDFMFLTETWNDQNLDIPGFETINSIIVQTYSSVAHMSRLKNQIISKKTFSKN